MRVRVDRENQVNGFQFKHRFSEERQWVGRLQGERGAWWKESGGGVRGKDGEREGREGDGVKASESDFGGHKAPVAVGGWFGAKDTTRGRGSARGKWASRE